MIFEQLFDDKSSTYTYVIASGKGREALIIDPVIEHSDHYIKVLEDLELKLVKVIDTHIHADHVTGLNELNKRTNCTRIMGEKSKSEVIDLRTLYPLDTETINSSVKKTGRALVVTEDCLTAGVSAELSARIMEGSFEFLEEPVLRLAGEDIPIPVSPSMEKEAVPSVDRIFSTAKLLLRK